jgi:hypothetical protein
VTSVICALQRKEKNVHEFTLNRFSQGRTELAIEPKALSRTSEECFLFSPVQLAASAGCISRQGKCRADLLSLSLRSARCVLRTYGHEVLVVTFTFIIAASEA